MGAFGPADMARLAAAILLGCSLSAILLGCSQPVVFDFRVQFDVETTDGAGSFVIAVKEDWSPHGATQFKELVKSGFYDNTRFFRVVPTFVVQFGISGDPATSAKWDSKTIQDDPVKESNQPGYVTFAKTDAPNSRTTQLFINYVDNEFLDSQGFAPFGLVEGDGMEVVKKIFNCGEEPDQGKIQAQGNPYLDNNFPKLSKIVKATVLSEQETEKNETDNRI